MPPVALRAVAWCPSGKRLATVGFERTVTIWDTTTGKEIRTLRGHTGDVFSVSWSPDGTRLASGGDTVKIWDPSTGKEILTLKMRGAPSVVNPTLYGSLSTVAWSPDGSRLAASGLIFDATKGYRFMGRSADANYWTTLGVAHYRAGEWKAALAALDKSIHLRKERGSLDRFFAAMCHEKLGTKKEARGYFDQASHWMDRNQADNEELWRVRAEAAELVKSEKFQVAEVSLKADPERYSGRPPARIVFRGQIKANGPCTVTYAFLRSDRARSQTFTVTFLKPGVKNVSTEWPIGGAGRKMTGWQVLNVLTPSEVISEKAHFEVELNK